MYHQLYVESALTIITIISDGQRAGQMDYLDATDIVIVEPQHLQINLRLQVLYFTDLIVVQVELLKLKAALQSIDLLQEGGFHIDETQTIQD